MRRVAITGMAVASPFGNSIDDFWRGVCHGPAPLRAWSVPGFPELDRCLARLPQRNGQEPYAGVKELALDLVTRALADAGHGALPHGAGLALGSHFAETDVLARPLRPLGVPLLQQLAETLDIRGPTVNTPMGCAAGNQSLSWAAECVARGDADLMVAGGLDLIGAGCVGVFQYFDNLSAGLPRPFSPERDGFLPGEGGAMFVLEPWAAGGNVHGEFLGAASRHDAFHLTRPPPDGRGLAGALRQALRESGKHAGHVGYVNAHSPGTLANDPGEAAAYRDVFGPRGVPVSSTKAALGHAQGGANGLEAAVCLLALRHGLLPPTLNTEAADPALDLDLVVGTPRPAKVDVVVSSASGLGGGNCVLVLGRAAP